MTPPTWFDAVGRPRTTPACSCGREVAPMRFRAEDPRHQGLAPPQTSPIPDRCACSTDYRPVPEADGWWHLIPICEPAQSPTPLRRWQPSRPVLDSRPMILRLTRHGMADPAV